MTKSHSYNLMIKLNRERVREREKDGNLGQDEQS